MKDYSGNSNKTKQLAIEGESQPVKKEIKKVVDGKVQKAQKGEFRKAVEAFLPPEGVAEIKDHIILDVVVPTIKKIISDTVETILWGSVGANKPYGTRSNTISGRPSYQSHYDKHRNNPTERPVGRLADRYEFNHVELETRGEAMSLIDGLRDIIDQYESVTVAELYEMVGLSGDYTDNYYGWMDIRGVTITHERNGMWAVKLPKPIKLPSTIVG
jgi:hypothetical protein